jgi:preprotein translocase subunit YajC
MSTPTLLALTDPLGGLLLPILMIGIFYFLVLMPMRKQEKERKQRLAELKRGDQIVLTGGMLGRISRIEDDIAIVEIADKVKVRVLKKDITDLESNARADAKAKDKDGKKDDKDSKKDDTEGKDGKGKAEDGDSDDARKAG